MYIIIYPYLSVYLWLIVDINSQKSGQGTWSLVSAFPNFGKVTGRSCGRGRKIPVPRFTKKNKSKGLGCWEGVKNKSLFYKKPTKKTSKDPWKKTMKDPINKTSASFVDSKTRDFFPIGFKSQGTSLERPRIVQPVGFSTWKLKWNEMIRYFSLGIIRKTWYMKSILCYVYEVQWSSCKHPSWNDINNYQHT